MKFKGRNKKFSDLKFDINTMYNITEEVDVYS